MDPRDVGDARNLCAVREPIEGAEGKLRSLSLCAVSDRRVSPSKRAPFQLRTRASVTSVEVEPFMLGGDIRRDTTDFILENDTPNRRCEHEIDVVLISGGERWTQRAAVQR